MNRLLIILMLGAFLIPFAIAPEPFCEYVCEECPEGWTCEQSAFCFQQDAGQNVPGVLCVPPEDDNGGENGAGDNGDENGGDENGNGGPPPTSFEGEVDTEVLARDGAMHLCGTGWNLDDIDDVQQHDICTVLTTADNVEYTCFSKGGHLGWVEEDNLRAVVIDSNEYQNVLEGRGITVEDDWDAVTCANGDPVGATIRYSHPVGSFTSPTFGIGTCPSDTCVQSLSNLGSSQCVPIGTVASGSTLGEFVCRDENGEGVWLSTLAYLANYTSRYASGTSVMNCGVGEFTANQRGGSLSFCQFARLSGSQANTVVTSVLITDPEQQVPTVLAEMRRLGINVEGITYDESSAIQGLSAVLTYNPELFSTQLGSEEVPFGVLSFYYGSGDQGATARFFDWLSSLFTPDRVQELDLVSTTGVQYYVHYSGGAPRQYAVEYQIDTNLRGIPVIVGADGASPYSRPAWRRIIQTR